jgi:hypothetical protein
LSGELVDQCFVTTLYSSESLKDFLNKRMFLLSLSEACTLYTEYTVYSYTVQRSQNSKWKMLSLHMPILKI